MATEMIVREYALAGMGKRNIPESYIKRILGGVAVAGIRPDQTATANTSRVLDDVLDRLAKRLGTVADDVPEAEPETKEPKSAQLDQGSNPNTYAKSLLNGVDPITKEKLSSVTLLGGVKALFNPSTRVTYPIPLTEKLQELL
jgi:hypothetical protein